MFEKIFSSIKYFAHTLQTPFGWTDDNVGISQVFVASETDPLRGEFYVCIVLTKTLF
jgi:hypothetical protein